MKDKAILFLQCADPGYYPPLLNATAILADSSWYVTMLGAPILGSEIAVPSNGRVRLESIPPRKSHVFGALDYCRYLAMTLWLAHITKPSVIYASDRVSAGPALLAQSLTRAKLIYHEHDSLNSGCPPTFLNRMREVMLRHADFLIFPNAGRAGIVQKEYQIDSHNISIVWNAPRRAELPGLSPKNNAPLVLYFHGSITPERLPLAVVEAVSQLEGRVKLQVAGYEAPGARGYLSALLEAGRLSRQANVVNYLGQIPQRRDLLAIAAKADIGLSLMPSKSDDINMQYMVGASNKPFDYMAAGLPLLVSELPDWRKTFVDHGYGLACNPDSVDSIATALRWFLDHPLERREMGIRGRKKIEADWNYETVFAPIIAKITAPSATGLR